MIPKAGLIMTPGPTLVNERVRAAMAQPITNPDLDPAFFAFYDATCARLQTLLQTREDVLVLSGEAILGLEAAVASLVEPGDRVLCLDNGVYGNGFGDFVRMYGGEVTYLTKEYHEAITGQDVQDFLAANGPFKVATLVHCETPAGLRNPIQEICPVLHAAGIISVVDAVSSIGGEVVAVDDWKIDMIIGGSQKCLSAPPGLTFLTVSERAWEKINQRQNPIAGYYVNLKTWQEMYYKDQVFPYTPPISDIYGLAEAVEIALEAGNDIFGRHARLAKAIRATLREAGFALFPEAGAEANTVTAFYVPTGIDEADFRRHIWEEYRVMFAGSWGKIARKVWRIGHMGENAGEDKLFAFFRAFDRSLADFDHHLPVSLSQIFASKLSADQ